MDTIIKEVKPQIWNFEVMRGKDAHKEGAGAWEEVVYSARMSGVPPEAQGKDVFKMIVQNDYSSALEHVIIKFDVKMAKGNAPEFLEHRMVSHTGFSTRFIKASEGIDKKEPVYEIIMPWHLLKLKSLKDKEPSQKKTFLKSIKMGIETYERLLQEGLPRESARYALPFCQAVGIYHVTINLRSLLNLLGLRLCVRVSPEFRCLAAQLYFKLLEELPIMKGLVGCRGFMNKVCPEVGAVSLGKDSSYSSCAFRNFGTRIFIPSWEEVMNGLGTNFNIIQAIKVQEQIFRRWASWER